MGRQRPTDVGDAPMTSQEAAALFNSDELMPRFVPPGFEKAKCSGCGERIMWGVSVDPITLRPKIRNGREVRVPLNIRRHPDGQWLMTGNGKVRYIAKGEQFIRPEDRIQGHHATCPKVGQFRRRGGAR